MAKNQTVDIQKGIFSLNRFKAWCYYSTVSADFNTSNRYFCHKPRSNNNFESVALKFNRDRNPHTPGFILPTEQVNHCDNPALLFQEHWLREGKIRRKNHGCPRKKFHLGKIYPYAVDFVERGAIILLLPDLQGFVLGVSNSCDE